MMNKRLDRRGFIKAAGAVSVCAAAGRSWGTARPLPNILWLTSEDNGPHLGCYGDAFADTPNIDGLARMGMIYKRAWSNAPVCAPARTTIITGVFPPSTGSEHMRSQTRMPQFMKMYPQFLREAGYYCTNNSKEDYNLAKPAGVWDDSSAKGHWHNRKAGQAFFAIFNFTTTHESQIRLRPHKAVHDPAKVRVPAYHPDAPEVRQDWAQYYDKITQMDGQVGRVLAELKADGLEEDTIVFYYGDHGSGMPRNKRWPYNSGLHVPMVVYFPRKFRHLAPPEYQAGGVSDRLVSFVDLAPTLLSLIGVRPPQWMQGKAFAGPYVTDKPKYLYGFRGRMDERYDLVRSVTDGRYVYLRQYMPHKVYGQFVSYMFQTPTTRKWKELYDAGKLNAAQRIFWERKPPEELYDLETDPDEVHNLAGSPEHREVLERMRAEQRRWVREIRDVGFLPEDEIHSRSAGSTPYEVGHGTTDEGRGMRDEAGQRETGPAGQGYPMERIMETAEAASMLRPEATARLIEAMGDEDSAVRYWAAMGLLMRDKAGVTAGREALLTAMRTDASGSVRAICATAVTQYGPDDDFAEALEVLMQLATLEGNTHFVAMLALTGINELGERARPLKDRIAALPAKSQAEPPRAGEYVGRLLATIAEDLK